MEDKNFERLITTTIIVSLVAWNVLLLYITLEVINILYYVI